MHLRPVLATLAALPLVALAGCNVAPNLTLGTRVLESVRLAPFGDCTELLAYFTANAADIVGPYGLTGGGWAGGEAMSGLEETADGDAGAAQESAESGGGDTAYSGTNNQEAGVDEADLVKTDGKIIVTALDGTVRVIDAGSGDVAATVPVPGTNTHPGELLLHGDELLVLSSEWSDWGHTDVADTMPAFPSTRTVVTRVDLSAPDAPEVLGSIRLEGDYRSARMIDGAVRLVMVTDPQGLSFRYPDTGSMTAEAEAEMANRQILADSTIEDWVPHLQVLDADGRVQETQILLDCDDISRPRVFSGLSTLSVLTFDLTGDAIEPTSATGLVASGQTVYASTDRLVVATSPWDLWAMGWDVRRAEPEEPSTDLHTFDIGDPSDTDYVASGTVQGRLLNQFSLDEEDGVLRVATTTGDMWGAAPDSESALIVLREVGDELVESGRVGGLGKTEEIHAVRYLSADLAAVVTFRQTDPLYLLDTSDPTDPRLLGELKIPGYSAYLHPLGEGLLLGIGQEADEESGATEGLQASLFDISDPRDPQRISQLTWPHTYSPVEWDHRAFLYWEQTGQLFLSASTWSEDEKDNFSGVLTSTVEGSSLVEGPRGATAADTWGEGPARVLVVGDQLYALDYEGMSRFDLATMDGGRITRW